jgi:outer membrane protein TolC
MQYQAELYKKVEDIFGKLRQQHNQKIIAEAEFLNAESDYQQVYFQAESARSDLATAKTVLYETVDVDMDKPFPVDLELKLSEVHPDFDTILELAMRNNPDVRLKAFAEMSAKYGVDVYKAKKLPHFDLRGAYGYQGEVYRDTEAIEAGDASNTLKKEWYLGIHGSMPLGASSVEYDQIKHQWGPTISAYQGSMDWTHKATFNLFDKFSDITDEKNAQASYLQSQSDFEKARNDLSSKLREDFFNLQKTMIQIDSAVAKIRYHEKQNAINEYLVSLQEKPAAEYLEGLIEYTQSRFAFIQAVVDYHLAVSGLSVSVGDPYYFDQ